MMKAQTKQNAGTLVAIVLTTDGLIHAYWTTGRIWPASNMRSLSQAVLNKDIVFKPIFVGPLAGLLFVAAIIILARVKQLGKCGHYLPDWLLQFGTLAIALGLLLRGLVGLKWILGWGASRNTPFYWFNLLAYTPLSLGLSAAALAAARAE